MQFLPADPWNLSRNAGKTNAQFAFESGIPEDIVNNIIAGIQPHRRRDRGASRKRYQDSAHSGLNFEVNYRQMLRTLKKAAHK